MPRPYHLREFGVKPDDAESPLMGYAWRYRLPVAVEDLKKVIAGNVRAMLGIEGPKSGVSKLIRLGFSNGNAQRVLEGETHIRLDLLAAVASALRVQPWQLCVPEIDPKNLPALQSEVDPDTAKVLAIMRDLSPPRRKALLRVADAMLTPAGVNLVMLDGDPVASPAPTPAPVPHK